MKTALLLLTGFFLTLPAFAAEIKVAAAADLRFALEAIAHEYEASHPGEKVAITYGASGKFQTQIQEGAPFDLFFSADTEKAEALVKAGKAAGATFPYAHGHLVVWVKKDSKISLDGKLKCLGSPGVKKISVANPVTAPYGQIAEAALKKAGLYEGLKPKFVTGENIAQTAQFVESGAADIGLIAKSLALSPTLKDGRFEDVDPSLYQPLLQSGVVLRGPHVKEAQAFRTYFNGPEGTASLKKFGLGL